MKPKPKLTNDYTKDFNYLLQYFKIKLKIARFYSYSSQPLGKGFQIYLNFYNNKPVVGVIVYEKDLSSNKSIERNLRNLWFMATPQRVKK